MENTLTALKLLGMSLREWLIATPMLQQDRDILLLLGQRWSLSCFFCILSWHTDYVCRLWLAQRILTHPSQARLSGRKFGQPLQHGNCALDKGIKKPLRFLEKGEKMGLLTRYSWMRSWKHNNHQPTTGPNPWILLNYIVMRCYETSETSEPSLHPNSICARAPMVSLSKRRLGQGRWCTRPACRLDNSGCILFQLEFLNIFSHIHVLLFIVWHMFRHRCTLKMFI